MAGPPVARIGSDRFPLCALIDPQFDRFYLSLRELAVHRHPRRIEPGDERVQSAVLSLARDEDDPVLCALQRRFASA